MTVIIVIGSWTVLTILRVPEIAINMEKSRNTVPNASVGVISVINQLAAAIRLALPVDTPIAYRLGVTAHWKKKALG
jgi:hypothetical protein